MPFGVGEIGFVWVCFFGAGRRFHFHNPFVKRRLRSIWNPPTADKIGFVWVCVFGAGRRFHFHNPFVKKRLRSIWNPPTVDKIGFVWVCFSDFTKCHLHINTCYQRVYVDLRVLDFGFVLDKKVDL